MIPQHSSKSVEHFTPEAIVSAAREVLGDIDLDPASCARANDRVRAREFFDELRDGLAREWLGSVFHNPPGGAPPPRWSSVYESRSSAVVWWRKLVTEFQLGHVTRGIFIGFNLEILQSSQGSAWPCVLDFPFCVPNKRLRFDVEADALAAALRLERVAANEKRILVIDEKLKFLDQHRGEIVSGDQPTHANVIVLVGGNVERFRSSFSAIGKVVSL